MGISEADISKQTKMKEELRKEFLKRTRKLLESKLCCRNLIKRMNTWAVIFERQGRCSRPFFKCTKDDVRQMNQRMKELMTMHKVLHPRDDMDCLYVSRKEGKRWLASIEYWTDAKIRGLAEYTKKSKEKLITTANSSNVNQWTNSKTKNLLILQVTIWVDCTWDVLKTAKKRKLLERKGIQWNTTSRS